MPSIAFENFADLVVNKEEISQGEKMLEMSEVPLMTILAESIPRSACPSYRRDRVRERNQNRLPLLGSSERGEFEAGSVLATVRRSVGHGPSANAIQTVTLHRGPRTGRVGLKPASKLVQSCGPRRQT